MNKYYHLLLTITLVFLLQVGNTQNGNISGIINSYAAVSNITNGNNCSSTLTVDDSNGFSVGDIILIIQMQGAVINESNSSNFGDINNLNSAGLFERAEISNIAGNTISTTGSLINNYQTTGKVQVVNMLQYADATVTTELNAMPWDGSKGGILAMEISGSLSLMADINLTATGFRGGTTSNPSSNCSFVTNESDYHYPLGAWESEGKGEGVAAYIAGKEYGRGAQANGGGGANDHNAGGGGGAGIGSGGAGGENQEPSIFGCKGNFPGLGGKSINHTDFRLFLGGGGGAGHDNNNVATYGGAGGGIIFISANNIISNGNSIISNGADVAPTTDKDGGGGGGGGGTIHINANNITDPISLIVKGGKGSNTNNDNEDRCMGPGGGGGGGAIYSNLNGGMLSTDISGGISGIVFNSTNGCNGSNNNAQAGTNGGIFPLGNIAFNPGPSSEMLTGTYCVGSNFSIMVNGNVYDENTPTGTEVLMTQYGCDSTVNINLDFILGGSSSISPTICFDESVVVNGTIYDFNMSSGIETIGPSANGCDSTVFVSLSFSPEMTVSETTTDNTVNINVLGGSTPYTYNWSNGGNGNSNTLSSSGDYMVTVTDAFGCEKIHTFSFINTSNEELATTYGIQVFPNPVQDILNLQRGENFGKWELQIINLLGQEVLSQQWQNDEQSQIDVSRLPKGIYLLNIKGNDWEYSKKISVE